MRNFLRQVWAGSDVVTPPAVTLPPVPEVAEPPRDRPLREVLQDPRHGWAMLAEDPAAVDAIETRLRAIDPGPISALGHGTYKTVVGLGDNLVARLERVNHLRTTDGAPHWHKLPPELLRPSAVFTVKTASLGRVRVEVMERLSPVGDAEVAQMTQQLRDKGIQWPDPGKANMGRRRSGQLAVHDWSGPIAKEMRTPQRFL